MSHPLSPIRAWFVKKGWQPLPHQEETWARYLDGRDVLLVSDTGSGKTLAAFMGAAAEALAMRDDAGRPRATGRRMAATADFEAPKAAAENAPAEEALAAGLHLLWITPMRALTVDVAYQLQTAVDGLGLPWRVEARTSDTSASTKRRQLTRPPEVLVTTPESLSLLLSYRSFYDSLGGLRLVVVDEWHELLATKRGTQTELGLARLARSCPGLRRIGLTATIANVEEAFDALTGGGGEGGMAQLSARTGGGGEGGIAHLGARTVGDRDHGFVHFGTLTGGGGRSIVDGTTGKLPLIDSVLPEDPETFPWAGHYGLRMASALADELEHVATSLVFTNTRAQAEAWYRAILHQKPDWAGVVALHHGSLDAESRQWVEDALRAGRLRCCVCTSTLELGVDLPAVERVFHVGSIGGIARLLQRAGRSGHRPGERSHITCVPTYLLQLIEVESARRALARGEVEARRPVEAPLDLLVQHAVTAGCGTGFTPDELYVEVTSTYAYRGLSRQAFDWAVRFAATGGETLRAYDEYERLVLFKDRYIAKDRQTAGAHRQAIGTIVADPRIRVKYERGSSLGEIEASFVARLKRGDYFYFAGRLLEYRRFDYQRGVVLVRRGTGSPDVEDIAVPRWAGTTLPFSSLLGSALREALAEFADPAAASIAEYSALAPQLARQRSTSHIPSDDELLIERVRSREGYHCFLYPFEGRQVHEGLAVLLAARFGRMRPATYRLSYNDYGLELLSPEPAPLEEALAAGRLFAPLESEEEVGEVLAQTRAARRHFREIARVAVIVHPGPPGRAKPASQIQATAGLLYDVFERYDPANPLLEQAAREAAQRYFDRDQLEAALHRLQYCRVVATEPGKMTPFALPLYADRLGDRLSSEKLADRLRRIQEEMLRG